MEGKTRTEPSLFMGLFAHLGLQYKRGTSQDRDIIFVPSRWIGEESFGAGRRFHLTTKNLLCHRSGIAFTLGPAL